MSEEKTSRWAIPYGIGSEKLLKILRFIKQKDGDKKYIPLDSILSLTSINPQSIQNNLTFFTIIKILEGDNTKGYKLTDNGTKLVSSTISGKAEDVKSAMLDIIKNSHLNDLKDFIETEGIGITKSSLFSFIKDRGNISDGDRFGNMSPVYSSGTSGLLELFEKSGLISENVLSKSASKSPNQKQSLKAKPSPKGKAKPPPKGKAKPSPKGKAKDNNGEISSSESHNFQSNMFSISINKKIEKDEFNLIKSQITNFLQFVEKKISNPNNSTI